jgi:histidine ammonia-lyase
MTQFPLTIRRGGPAAPEIVLGADALTIEDVHAVAHGGAGVRLSDAPDFVQRIQEGTAFLDTLLEEDGVIYGVTTGYGDSCTVPVPRALIDELPLHLSRFHGCGLGAHLPHATARGVLVARLASLCRGYSGVRLELLQRLVEFLNLDVMPVIPEEGSVGASGDLTPLSYVAALLVGEREASHLGSTLSAAEAHRRFGLQPLALRPKEGLAVMNGTAVMTALACEAFMRAEYLTRLAARITALATLALRGNHYHFDERLFAVKPHPGQSEIAAWIRRDLVVGETPRNPDRLQDRYSIRCAPHVIGVLRDSLPWMRGFLEIELNSANDNPIIDGAGQHVLHGGHFYGGHVAFVMDSLKNCVANLADLMDRQLALLVDPKFSNGLPPNLSGAAKHRQSINHGFKAVQIGASAWTAEALKLTMPASVFSRSTECHNQDKVSMGSIAARDCLRVLQLTEQVAAAQLLAVAQAIELRRREPATDAGTPIAGLRQEPKQFVDAVFEAFAFLDEDRPLEPDLRKFVAMVQDRHWPLYA